jgi:hypothetical protein
MDPRSGKNPGKVEWKPEATLVVGFIFTAGFLFFLQLGGNDHFGDPYWPEWLEIHRISQRYGGPVWVPVYFALIGTVGLLFSSLLATLHWVTFQVTTTWWVRLLVGWGFLGITVVGSYVFARHIF